MVTIRRLAEHVGNREERAEGFELTRFAADFPDRPRIAHLRVMNVRIAVEAAGRVEHFRYDPATGPAK